MKQSHKEELIDLIKSHYPNHTADIEDIEVIGDGIMLTGNGGNQVIYRIVDNKVRFYKMNDHAHSGSDSVNKWKAIIRQAKLLNLE